MKLIGTYQQCCLAIDIANYETHKLLFYSYTHKKKVEERVASYSQLVF